MHGSAVNNDQIFVLLVFFWRIGKPGPNSQHCVQAPLNTFPCSFPVDGEVAKLPTCCGLATGKLQGNWSDGFWPLPDVYLKTKMTALG